jgi:hypothetical protein
MACPANRGRVDSGQLSHPEEPARGPLLNGCAPTGTGWAAQKFSLLGVIPKCGQALSPWPKLGRRHRRGGLSRGEDADR